MKTIAFFNNKGGVGKTSLVYHLAWMCADHGIPTLAVDLDPQANLTSFFLNEAELDELWGAPDTACTLYGGIAPLLHGTGDIAPVQPQAITDNLSLLAGDLRLFGFEEPLATAWMRCASGDESAFRAVTAFYRIIEAIAAPAYRLVLLDLAPNLGAINRAALNAAGRFCLPLAPDLASLNGLNSLGRRVGEWQDASRQLIMPSPASLPRPHQSIDPIGYIVVLPQALHRGKPTLAYQRWLSRIPQAYHEALLDEPIVEPLTVEQDAACLGVVRHHRSLMLMAMEARKPMFFLKPADGAIGAFGEAVRSSYRDFEQLASRIVAQAGIPFN